MNNNKNYVVGIDLGTTNSSMSYVDLRLDGLQNKNATNGFGKKPIIKIFNIPQLTGAGQVSMLPVLPSFFYIPGQYDIPEDAIKLPWKNDEKNFVGTYAMNHGAKVPNRLVSSAKSWLCHSNIDRNARILPWGSNVDMVKVSPVHATASYLTHLKSAWNNDKQGDEDLYLENQIVIITVPASFDEVARDLTLEAAKKAGLSNVTLLEEPLAAFYSWLIDHEHHWEKYIKLNELILVCDVGGGTTDFTLITLREVDGNPRFERIAVGDHLILGGDNVDLALARQVEMNLEGSRKKTLSYDRWRSICHQCRQAKENIFDGNEELKKITLLGDGSKLIKGTISTVLEKDEVYKIVLDGFFPKVDSNLVKIKAKRKGITEQGLLYEQEPSITSHLGWFLERHKDDVKKYLNKDLPVPELILFNGGSLKPDVIQQRIRKSIRYWFKVKDDNFPVILENPHPYLAVALGAAYYGLVKLGRGVRVGSGSARAFYLGVTRTENLNGQNDIGEKNRKISICVVERGLEEGTKIELKDKKFEVLTNQPVSFDLYSSSYRFGDKCGDQIEIDDTLTFLPPLKTVILYGKKGTKTKIPVQLEATYTEMGTLAIWCCSLKSSHKWQLKFQLRGTKENTTSIASVLKEEVFEESVVNSVCIKVKDAFLNNSKSSGIETLVKDINCILKDANIERSKYKWPLGFIRSISDELLKHIEVRQTSPEHEIRWQNTVGLCLRPGFGDGFDEQRLKILWKIQKQGPIHVKNAQVRSEWWIMWRRVAGGLSFGQQKQFAQDIFSILMPKKGFKVRISHQERLEIWMAAANLERLLVKDKIKLGKLLISESTPKKCKPQHLWALSRIGARELLYGSQDRVIPPEIICGWIDTLLLFNWGNPKPVGSAIAQLSRKTGDRVRDLDSAMVNKVLDWMDQHIPLENQQKYVKEIIPFVKQEQTMIFGESLPPGIILRDQI